ncbi:hypothetical protein F9U64_17925 [Gracilibacillus oryzae]|uniref:Replicative helicase inhibitor G39P N-terminal domain-containing protein n=1 Tax=Gracilibacillus oryzae TaxID=1672701 RepID=A0A7C8GR80_9BACI|nr:hypothetical protein [Gracilibacillus oryzae]KAB8127390.1 hypothetical protein F9U64_17925 [Gracilibacillus oryzae]
MMEKKTFQTLMNRLFIFFPNWNIKLEDPHVAKEWYQQFESCTDQEFSLMIQTYIDKETYPPTVAGLKQYLIEQQRKSMEQLEWEQTIKQWDRGNE